MNRELSTYAFRYYGNNALIYNGIHDLETMLEDAEQRLGIADFNESEERWVAAFRNGPCD
jgi:hypothetical protein